MDFCEAICQFRPHDTILTAMIVRNLQTNENQQ